MSLGRRRLRWGEGAWREVELNGRSWSSVWQPPRPPWRVAPWDGCVAGPDDAVIVPSRAARDRAGSATARKWRSEPTQPRAAAGGPHLCQHAMQAPTNLERASALACVELLAGWRECVRACASAAGVLNPTRACADGNTWNRARVRCGCIEPVGGSVVFARPACPARAWIGGAGSREVNGERLARAPGCVLPVLLVLRRRKAGGDGEVERGGTVGAVGTLH